MEKIYQEDFKEEVVLEDRVPSDQWKDFLVRDGKVSRSSQFNKLIRCLTKTLSGIKSMHSCHVD